MTDTIIIHKRGYSWEYCPEGARLDIERHEAVHQAYEVRVSHDMALRNQWAEIAAVATRAYFAHINGLWNNRAHGLKGGCPICKRIYTE